MKALEKVLTDIQEVAKKKNLKYHLDAKFEDGSAAVGQNWDEMEVLA